MLHHYSTVTGVVTRILTNAYGASHALEGEVVLSGRAAHANLCITADVSSGRVLLLMISRW